MKDTSILIVEDDPLVLKGFEIALKEEGYHVTSIRDGKDALEAIEKDKFQLILTDLMLGETDGIKVLRKTKKISPKTLVVIITGYESMNSAIKALREGAYDYLIKPCRDVDLKMTVKRGLERWRLEEELMKAEKLIAVTQTAVTANHEINSPLQTILMSAELLLFESENLNKTSRDRLEVILSETLKIRDVVKRLTKMSESLTN
ncbi:MAG TPA: response regulator [Nitrospinota bacterium]|nr:response regulator [Nitrospinota bacterium]